jgi:spore germination cell wall hydrolase CwlJ-like protein
LFERRSSGNTGTLQTIAFKSKVRNKFLTGQSREIVSSLLQFMTLEARENTPIIALSKVLERVTAATGVSIRTLRKQEKKQVDNGERNEFNTLNKKRPGRNRKKTIILNDADQGILRRTIYNFHTTEKQVPTLKKIQSRYVDMYQSNCDHVLIDDSNKFQILVCKRQS